MSEIVLCRTIVLVPSTADFTPPRRRRPGFLGRLRLLPARLPWHDRGMTPTLHITDDETADALLSTNPLALLIGMLLDQQVR